MGNFEDHLWREFVREHGDALTKTRRPVATPTRGLGPRLMLGAGLGVAGIGGVIALALGAATTSPAFAVTRNHDGTVTISITRPSGVAGANAKLHQLGIRASVMTQAPVDCTPTPSHPAGTQSATTPSYGTHEIANARWTINPRQIPVDSTLALTPPPAPPGGSGADGASSGQMWSCGTEGPGPGTSSPPPDPRSGDSGNGNTSTSG